MFVTFEGIEGCGKSTQARRLLTALEPSALLTHEPGGTTLGRAIRTLLLGPIGSLSPEAELLLYFSDRAQHVAEIIRPALGQGRTVICDRFADSTVAYQGYGRRLSLSLIRTLADAATGGLRPDVTVLIDVPVAIGLGRVRKRAVRDRMEAEPDSFHERVRVGYLEIARAEPQRVLRVDGEGSPDQVEERVRAALRGQGMLTDFHVIR